MKGTEVLFKTRVIPQETGISKEKNLDFKIQSAVLQQVGAEVFSNYRTHFFNQIIGQEMDMSCLLQKLLSSYLYMILNPYGKRYSEIVVQRSEASLRYNLAKIILLHTQQKNIMYTIYICKYCS